MPAPAAFEPMFGKPYCPKNECHHPKQCARSHNQIYKIKIDKEHGPATWGKRSNGFALGPLEGTVADCGGRAGEFAPTPLAGAGAGAGARAAGGISACSGIP